MGHNFDGSPYTQLTAPARGDIQGVIKDISEALPENQTKFAALEDLLKFGPWASKVRSVTASGAVTLADTDPIFIEINPNGADRDVNFPAKSDDNHGYFVRHSGSANTLTLKRSGTATITTLTAGEAKYIMPSTLNDFSALAGGAAAAGGGDKYPMEARLTLETGVAISTTNQTAKTTLYLTKYKGDQIAVYDGVSAWSVIALGADISITLASLTASLPYDVFVYSNAGTLTLELAAWTNTTTRATALTTQNGVYVKTGATTRRYLGTICITATTGQCEDSLLFRGVYNYYNRVKRKIAVRDATAQWNYSTNTWRQMNGASANKAEFIIGVNENLVTATNTDRIIADNVEQPQISIGLDATNAVATDAVICTIYLAGTQMQLSTTATYSGYPGIGYHYLCPIERAAAGAPDFFGGDFQLFVGELIM